LRASLPPEVSTAAVPLLSPMYSMLVDFCRVGVAAHGLLSWILAEGVGFCAFMGRVNWFKVPLLGRWARWIGGIPLDRHHKHGVVGHTVAAMAQARERGELFWLAAAPEGTRSLTPGWRSGAYQVAVQAGVPAGLAYFDVPTRTVGLTHFVQLTGDVEADFAALRAVYAGKQGFRPALASPVQLR
jgi:hypothetical protein